MIKQILWSEWLEFYLFAAVAVNYVTWTWLNFQNISFPCSISSFKFDVSMNETVFDMGTELTVKIPMWELIMKTY